MGSIANELAGIKTSLDTALAAIATLASGITALKAQIGPQNGDTLSPSSQAALDALVTEASSVASGATADVAELPPPPAPPAA